MMASLLTTIGCGGGGETSSAVLFVADIAHGTIAGFPEVNPPAGSTMSGRAISGIASLGNRLAYDAQTGRLFATSGGSVIIFDGAGTLSGNPPPTRTITPTGTAFIGRVSLFLDRAKDTLTSEAARSMPAPWSSSVTPAPPRARSLPTAS